MFIGYSFKAELSFLPVRQLSYGIRVVMQRGGGGGGGGRQILSCQSDPAFKIVSIHLKVFGYIYFPDIFTTRNIFCVLLFASFDMESLRIASALSLMQEFAPRGTVDRVNGSNTDGSFTTAASNSFLSLLEKNPISAELE